MHLRIAFALSLLVSPLAACDHDDCCGGDSAAQAKTKEAAAIATLAPREVAALQSAGSLVIVDANPRKVYDAGHLPGAVWLESDDVTTVLPKDRAARVVFYCYSEACTASHAAAQAAVAAGWTNVARMPAGITGWKAAGLAVEPAAL